MVILISGCNNDSSKLTQAEVKTHQADSPNDSAPLESKKTQWVTAHGKPGAQVSFVNNEVYQLEPGVAGDLDLQLNAAYGEGEMTVSVTLDEGLALLAGATEHTFPLGQDQRYLIPMTVMGQEAGRFYVTLHISIAHAGHEAFKSIAAIVQVGPEAVKATERNLFEKSNHSDGVVVLPAEEEIIQE